MKEYLSSFQQFWIFCKWTILILHWRLSPVSCGFCFVLFLIVLWVCLYDYYLATHILPNLVIKQEWKMISYNWNFSTRFYKHWKLSKLKLLIVPWLILYYGCRFYWHRIPYFPKLNKPMYVPKEFNQNSITKFNLGIYSPLYQDLCWT